MGTGSGPGTDATLILAVLPFLVCLLPAHTSHPDLPRSILGDQEMTQQGARCPWDPHSLGLLPHLSEWSLAKEQEVTNLPVSFICP